MDRGLFSSINYILSLSLLIAQYLSVYTIHVCIWTLSKQHINRMRIVVLCFRAKDWCVLESGADRGIESQVLLQP